MSFGPVPLEHFGLFQEYVPPPFIVPTVLGSPLLVDWFSDRNAIGKKWLTSKGKKDDVEDSIAKYNGFIFFNIAVLKLNDNYDS